MKTVGTYISSSEDAKHYLNFYEEFLNDKNEHDVKVKEIEDRKEYLVIKHSLLLCLGQEYVDTFLPNYEKNIKDVENELDIAKNDKKGMKNVVIETLKGILESNKILTNIKK